MPNELTERQSKQIIQKTSIATAPQEIDCLKSSQLSRFVPFWSARNLLQIYHPNQGALSIHILPFCYTVKGDAFPKTTTIYASHLAASFTSCQSDDWKLWIPWVWHRGGNPVEGFFDGRDTLLK